RLRVVPCQGEKNHGFDVLYHNMKHGQISTKELADFVRERYWAGQLGRGGPSIAGHPPHPPLPAVPRAAIEENYAKAMVKLSKMATNGTQLGTFAPLWEVFRISSDKLALCHLELMKKLQDLIKEISRYGEEQGRVHKKVPPPSPSSPTAPQTPPAHPFLPFVCVPIPPPPVQGGGAELKSKKAGEALRRAVEKYNAARADFEQRMLDSAVRFQEVEEAHLRHMKGLIGSYSHSVEDTHVQIGQVHEEFKQNVENIGTEMLLRRFAESKGTGRERPGEVLGGIPVGGEYPSASPGAGRSVFFPYWENWRASPSPSISPQGCPEVDEDGFTVRPDISRSILVLESGAEVENHGCSSSDSDYDEDEPRKFYVHIKPVQPREAAGSAEATMEQLKATVGNLILHPSLGVSLGKCWGGCCSRVSRDGAKTGDSPSVSIFLQGTVKRQSSRECHPLGLDVAVARGGPRAPCPPPPRTPCPLKSACPCPSAGHVTSLTPAPSGADPEGMLAAGEAVPGGGLQGGGPIRALTLSASPGLSRGPSPVVLGSQDALPVATAFTEYVHAYFKGRDADSCLVKVTGELTMSFPAGIIRVFNGTMAPPVLSFRLLNAGAIEQFLPNAELLYSDPSQSDPSTKDFWLNMAALTGHLQKQAEQSPAASYYNVALLKYQFSRLGPGSAPLRLCVRWDCSPSATRVTVEYGYNAGALALPVPLANVHVLLPVDEPVTNLRLQPAASWGWAWPLWTPPIPPLSSPSGCGRLSASWEPVCGPSKPSPVAAQFSSEGSTLSGVEVELASAGYRMSLVKKRFATGTAGGA
ncbi:FCHO1 protein, partial [Baryphthengus martii]|nr:FCHO1 protein [Baryphthengus martii]